MSEEYNSNSEMITVVVNKSPDNAEIIKLKRKIPEILDSLQFSGFHIWIIISLGISWVLDGYEVSLLSVLSGVLKHVFLMSDSDIGTAGSLYLSGCVVGSIIFGSLAGKFGRKTLFSVTLGVYIISIISTSISVNKYMFFICRFFTGISVGGEYSSIFAAIDEFIPPSIRGRADLIIDGTWHLGSSIASLVSYLTLNGFSDYQDYMIRILFIAGVLLALPVIYLRRLIPESPRWLLYRGKYKDAVNIVEKIQQKCKSKSYILNYSDSSENENASLILEKDNYKNIENQHIEEVTLKEIFKVLIFQHRRRFLYGLVLMASQAFFYNGIFYTYTLVLQNFYSISKETVGLYLIPLSCASFLGPIFIGYLFDTWSRRKMIAITFFIAGILLIITSINFITKFFSFPIQQIFWFITFFIASPAASSAHLTVSEIFPVELRSQALAIVFSIGLGTGGVIAPFLYGSFVQQNDKYTIFLSYMLAAAIMIFASIIGFCFGVDAENKSLEQIAKNIRDVDETEKF